MEETNTNTDSMSITATTYLAVIFKNLAWLLALAFYPVSEFLIQIFPIGWRDDLNDFKLIVGAIIMVLVFFKLVLEIIKLIKKK